jgi:transcriptional regulator with XRE-family HTH domain
VDLAWRVRHSPETGHSVTGMSTRYTSAAYRELGGMLRQVREQADLSAGQLARRMGWPLTKISRMEHGQRASSTTDVIQYVVMCGQKARDVERLIEFARLAERKQGYYLSDWRIAGSLQSLILHESAADHSIIYEPQLIPGLLQTPDYARARITALEPDIGEEEVESGIRTRMERRQILYQPHSSRFTFYLHEHALRLQVGSNEIMHEQLLHLVLTAALDNVAVRIVPRVAGEFGEPFRLMEFQEHPPIVYLDNLRLGGLVLEDRAYVGSYCDLVPKLARVALDEGQSRELAAGLADACDRGSNPGVSNVLAQEQLQQRNRNRLRGGGVVEPPTPIYE